MTLARVLARTAERNSLIERAVVTDLGGLADDDACSSILVKAFAAWRIARAEKV